MFRPKPNAVSGSSKDQTASDGSSQSPVGDVDPTSSITSEVKPITGAGGDEGVISRMMADK